MKGKKTITLPVGLRSYNYEGEDAICTYVEIINGLVDIIALLAKELKIEVEYTDHDSEVGVEDE